MNDQTKSCPFCAEQIKKDAIICRFCQMDLKKGQPVKAKNEPKEVQARSGVEDGVKLGCGMFIVLPLLIIGGLFFIVIMLGAC